MNESFLQYLWRYKLIKTNDLQSPTGDTINIISFGFYNNDAGPDFTNCKIKINDTLWAGNVEIHTKASDWYRHGHDKDQSYDNIILHVVYENDKMVTRRNNEPITTLVVKELFDKNLYDNYTRLMAAKQWVPCQTLLKTTDKSIIGIWKEKLIIERLERKTQAIIETVNTFNNDWEKAFQIHLFKNFGFKVNATAFEMLAKSIPVQILAKHKDNAFQIEALLFGQAGLIPGGFADAYTKLLTKEYAFLKQKYSLKPIYPPLWRLARMRPAGFPFVRMAQLAQLLHKSEFLFSKILESTHIKSLSELLKITAGNYWDTHYIFDKTSPFKPKRLGTSAANNVLINTFIPFIFAYAMQKNLPDKQQQALNFLSAVSAEKNSIITKWHNAGLTAGSAYDSQALIELKNNYCRLKKCLNCMIGHHILCQPKA